MTREIGHSPEATPLARIASAAWEVQAASAALEKRFSASGDARPSTLELARFAAAMHELRDARGIRPFDEPRVIQSGCIITRP